MRLRFANHRLAAGAWSVVGLGLGLFVGLGLALAPGKSTAADDWPAVRPGSVVLLRHALAPGGGDPPGFQLEDCKTQRNLSDEGRAQARRIGLAFKSRHIEVGAVWSSQWCRARETADLAFPNQRVDQPAFNSSFAQPDAVAEQTRAALAQLSGWRGPGVLVVVTHQVNITALTGVVPASGEAVVVEPGAQGLKLRGRVMP
jgi:phosphohistidine phosphatase SixA